MPAMRLPHERAVNLVEALHAKNLAALARDSRKAVNRVAVAQHFERFAEHHQRFALGIVDPAFGGAAHVDHEHDGEVALGFAAPGEKLGRELPAVAHVGVRFDDCVEIDAVAVGLALEQAILAAQKLEGAFELSDLRRVFGERGLDETGLPGCTSSSRSTHQFFR